MTEGQNRAVDVLHLWGINDFYQASAKKNSTKLLQIYVKYELNIAMQIRYQASFWNKTIKGITKQELLNQHD